jgi:HK97 family phage major capsid protein
MQEMTIEKIVEEMKSLTVENKSEFNTKFSELQNALKKRNDEYDKRFGDLETQREKFIKDQQDNLTKAIEEFKTAFKNSNKGEENKFDTKTYGNSFGEFMVKVKKQSPELKALSENIGVDGGFLVPEQWSNEVQKVSLEGNVFRTNGAKNITLVSTVLKIPALKYASNADGSQYGGVTAYWASEGEDLSARSTKPGFEYIEFNANKLIAYTESTEELLEDSMIALAPFLQQCFGEVINFKEDDAFLNGDGVGKPLGVLSADCRATVSRSTTSQIHPIDLVGCIARFKGDLNRAIWLVNQVSLPQLYTLQDNNGNFIFINNFNTNIQNNRTVGSLFGIPVKVSEKVPALGSEGDIGLYDIGQYIIADKSGLRVEESRDYQFHKDTRCWKLVKRVDGRPWMKSAITPFKGSSTLSPFVVLK